MDRRFGGLSFLYLYGDSAPPLFHGGSADSAAAPQQTTGTGPFMRIVVRAAQQFAWVSLHGASTIDRRQEKFSCRRRRVN